MTREPEWDDDERESMQALALYEGACCSGCGFHLSITEDKANLIEIEERTCGVCAGAAARGRVQSRRDDEAEKRMGANPPPALRRPTDGRKSFFRLLSDHEAERRRTANDSLAPSSR